VLCKRPTHNVAIKIYVTHKRGTIRLPGTVQMKTVTQHHHTSHQWIFALTLHCLQFWLYSCKRRNSRPKNV